MTRTLLALLLCLAFTGCDSLFVQPTGPDSSSPAKPAKPGDTKETLLSTLADRAAADPVFYTTTDDLVRVVNRLSATGDVTPDQAKAIGERLKVRRKLTSEDLDFVRGQ